jgi:hypothetical protein
MSLDTPGHWRDLEPNGWEEAASLDRMRPDAINGHFHRDARAPLLDDEDARHSATQPPTGSEPGYIGHRHCGDFLGRDENGCDERPDVRTRHRRIDVAASDCERLSALAPSLIPN